MSREVIPEGYDPDNYECTLATVQYLDQHLLPQVRTQQPHTCAFYAIAYAAEMQLRLNRWRRGLSSDVVFDPYNFSVDYELCVGHRLATPDELLYHRVHTAFDIFLRRGIYATSRDWPHRQRFLLTGYDLYPRLDPVEVFNMIGLEQRPVLGVFPVQEDFDDLVGNQIYELNPLATLENPPAYHMVMFMGYGRVAGRPYLLFLNAQGEGFGTNGIGRVFFDQVIQGQGVGFYTLTIDDLGPSSSAGTPPPTCRPPPPPDGAPPPPGGSAPPGSSASQCAFLYGSSQSSSQSKNRRVAWCSPSDTSSSSRTVTMIWISNDAQEIRLVQNLHPNLGAWKNALEQFTSFYLTELGKDARIEHCRATRDFSSCGRYVQHVLNSGVQASSSASCSQRWNVCPICRSPIPDNRNRVRPRLYQKYLEASLISKQHDERFQEKEGYGEPVNMDVRGLHSLFDTVLQNNLVSLICHYITDVCLVENAVPSDPLLAFLLDEVVIKDWCKRSDNAPKAMIYRSGLERMNSKLSQLQKSAVQLAGISSVVEAVVTSLSEAAHVNDMHQLTENTMEAKQHLEAMMWCTRHNFLELFCSCHASFATWSADVTKRKTSAEERQWTAFSAIHRVTTKTSRVYFSLAGATKPWGSTKLYGK